MAQRAARVLVVYHRRVGGQSQFSAMLDMQPETDRLRRAFIRLYGQPPQAVRRIAR
jgi:transcriptional regulator GlxA family with amidase domain